MKEYFVATIKGRLFEIKRISTSNFGTWYSISVILDEEVVQYNMSNTSGGLWKIITQRLPSVIYIFERELCDLIEKNEKNEKHTGYHPRFGLAI
ncbi:MAG: hypothetical protein JWR18_1422 [Segetibacter sp.]|jgi:hypothetical protein|nr:hypothetical protein [Segetibacter sp.]